MAKICSHENCSNPVFGGGFCKWHQSHRSDKNTERGRKQGTSRMSTSKKGSDSSRFELDRAFYMEIWESREHTCYNCSRFLPREPLTLYFHHLLNKQHYPQFRHEEWNIAILCSDCHYSYETYPNIRKHQKIIELTNKLKEEHG